MQTQIRDEVLPDLGYVPSIRTNKINISISGTSPLKMFAYLGSAKSKLIALFQITLLRSFRKKGNVE